MHEKESPQQEKAWNLGDPKLTEAAIGRGPTKAAGQASQNGCETLTGFAQRQGHLLKSQTPTLKSQAAALWHAQCLDMTRHTSMPPEKPYDIRERLFVFACEVVRTAQKLHTRGAIGVALSAQLVNAAVSAASNAEEADDDSSRRDFLAKERIALREIKETRLRLRVLRATDLLEPSGDLLVEESLELVKILSTIIRNASGPPSGDNEARDSC